MLRTSLICVMYVFDGVVRKYRPDFIIRLRTGTRLVVEVKDRIPRRTRPSEPRWMSGRAR